MAEFSDFPIKLDEKNFSGHVKNTYGSQDKSSTACLVIAFMRTHAHETVSFSVTKRLPEILSGIRACPYKGTKG
jgi:hypothetical protein